MIHSTNWNAEEQYHMPSWKATTVVIATAAVIARTAPRRDPLTGLHGRDGLNLVAPMLLGTYHLAVLDVRGLKRMNDTHGHDAGDEILRTCAHTLRQKTVYAARLGGDEFAAVTSCTSPERLEDALREDGVTATVGISLARPHTATPLAARLHAADIAMYARRNGGPGVVVGGINPSLRPGRRTRDDR